jgi:hypothetical protein
VYVEVQVYASLEVTWLEEDVLDVVDDVVVLLELRAVELDEVLDVDVVALELVA